MSNRVQMWGWFRLAMVRASRSNRSRNSERQGLNMAFTRRADFCRPTCWRVLPESKMSPVLVIQHDNATPIILYREKSVTFGTLGTLALWLFAEPSPEMGELCSSVASMRSQELGSWRSHNGCSIRWPAAVCPWQPCPVSAAVRCWIGRPCFDVRRFLTVTLCYKVSIVPCYLQEVLMRKSLTRQRVAQFKLFHPPQKRLSWQLLPLEARRKAERLLARL